MHVHVQCIYCATSSQDGRTALHMAAKCGHTETVRVQRGADPNQCADNAHVSEVILRKGILSWWGQISHQYLESTVLSSLALISREYHNLSGTPRGFIYTS